MIKSVVQILDERKARDIVAIDIRGISPVTDYVVIATANVDRHAKFLAKNLKDDLKEQGLELARAEGMGKGDWVVMDFFEIMVHIFTPEMREKYQIEKLWSDGKCEFRSNDWLVKM